MNPVALILARGGSKGLPGKHLQYLDGKPLIAHVVERAAEELGIESVFVSTDNEAINDAAQQCGATTIARPPAFATDKSPAAEAIFHAAAEGRLPDQVDVVAILAGATLIRRDGLIGECLDTLRNNQVDEVQTVIRAESRHPHWTYADEGDKRVHYEHADLSMGLTRQQLRPYLHIAGACCCVHRGSILRAAQQWKGRPAELWDSSCRIAAQEISELDALEIHTLEDLEFARLLYRGAATLTTMAPC